MYNDSTHHDSTRATPAMSTDDPSPDPRILEGVRKVLGPWWWYTDPVFEGLERIPADRPLLFVGNHTIYGILDIPLLFWELWHQKQIYLRPLGDRLHFKVPLWRELVRRFGAVEGSRPNCSRLMEAGESILVFPGGGREVTKRKRERYKLIWKERLGFARLAIRHGCTIVPFAAVGPEDAFDIVWDHDDFSRTPVGRLIERVTGRDDLLWPVARGLGPTPLPRPMRYYFHIGQPIRTAEYAGDFESRAACVDLRDRTRDAVQQGIDALRRRQARDPDSDRLAALVRRLLS